MSGDIAGQPRVIRPIPTARWDREHVWGVQLGDRTKYAVVTSGGSISIWQGSNSIKVPAALVAWLADAIAQAASWTDE